MVLAGNNLDNSCIVELLQVLGDPKAPRITQLDLAMNTTLSWQCTRALAAALGAHPLTSEGVSSDIELNVSVCVHFYVLIQTAVVLTHAGSCAGNTPAHK